MRTGARTDATQNCSWLLSPTSSSACDFDWTPVPINERDVSASTDPWGNAFLYRCSAHRSAVEVVSTGQDGKRNSDDDIVVDCSRKAR